MTLTPDRWRRITDLFHAARSRDAGDRAAFLDGECGGDPELRREVEAMLTGDRAAGDFGAAPLGGSTIDRRLTTGRVLGPYRIDGFIGAGGMGDVYRAKDTRIGRDVALKVLPAEFAADPERLRRFEQEARASGSLNHPNVVTLFDVGTIEGQPYLVTELLDGETLRDRIGHAPLPVRRACDIAADVARGLAAAHTKGIVHRDLKPENVMVTRDGRVKILDFGIAKLRPPDIDADARTMTTPLRTLPDTVMGTAGYMAPEQIRGEAVDARADIFALGATTFELLTGGRPFDRATRIETLNAVLHDDPPLLANPSFPIPPAVARIVRRCLEKDPEARFQSARDLAFAFDASSDETGVAGQPALRNRVSWGWPVAFAAALVAAVIAGALWVKARREPAARRDVTRFIVQPPASRAINGVRHDISPDGRLIAYRGVDNGVTRLFIRRLDQFDPVALPGTDGGSVPFFSPDGQWLGFLADGRLLKISIAATAPPIVLQEAPGALDASWPAADTILYGTIEQGIHRISPDGGAPTLLTSLDTSRHEFDHHVPRMLPGGRWLLFTSHEGADVFRVMVQELATGTRKVLIESGFDARYSPTGHLVYASGSSIFAVAFDVERAEVTGTPVKVIDGVATAPDSAIGGFALSDDGTIAYAAASPATDRTLAWVDRTGKEDAVAVSPRAFRAVRLSPDDSQVAIDVADGDREDVWIHTLQSDAFARVTFEGQNRHPLWTPDGQRLTYTALRDGVQHLMLQFARGGDAETLVSSRNNLAAGAWSPDGRTLLYVDSPPTDLSIISIVAREGQWRSTPLIARPTVDSPTLSPDGRWLAFVSFERPPQIIVQPFPGPGARHQITTDGGSSPVWSRAGGEIFYNNGTAMFAVPVETSHGFTAGKPIRLFEGAYLYSNPVLPPYPYSNPVSPPAYDASRDGRRFLMIKPGEAERARRELRVVVNWAEELTRRVPHAASR